MRFSYLTTAVLALLLAPRARAHYVQLINDCPNLIISGDIADIRGRGRSDRLRLGRTHTDGDTDIRLETGFGTVTVKLSTEITNITTLLDPSALLEARMILRGADSLAITIRTALRTVPKSVSFCGQIGLDKTLEAPSELKCSWSNRIGCINSMAILNGLGYRANAFARLKVEC